MKLVVSIGLVLIFTTTCFAAEVLTSDEVRSVRELLARKTRLTSLADNVGNETLPLEINILRKERENIIKERDAKISAIKTKAIEDINSLMATYETLIDNKENEIAQKESLLTN